MHSLYFCSGGGGCIRLPRLIGFRQSLGLLVTGQTISAQKALYLGIVDALIPNTKSQQELSTTTSYEYTWLIDILEFVKQRGIGNKPATLNKDVCEIYPPVAPMEGEEILSLTEDELNSVFKPWNECEEKLSRKYKSTRSIFSITVGFFINLLFCFITLIQIWRSVGLRMPAPYICLLTTLRCYYAGSWMEAMALNAVGFSTIAATAESKSLMHLFLSTRRLKKVALWFGLEQGLKAHDILNTKLVVLVSKRGMKFSAAVIQGLLYNRLSVYAIDVSGQLQQRNIIQEIHHLFQYSVKRGHMTDKDVDECISQLSFHSESVVDFCDEDIVVIDGSIGISDNLIKAMISRITFKVQFWATCTEFNCLRNGEAMSRLCKSKSNYFGTPYC